MERSEIQSKIIETILDNNCNCTIGAGMGIGKSFCAIEIIKRKQFKNILITGYRTSLKDNWEKELNKWNILKHVPSYSVEQLENYWINMCNTFTPLHLFPKIKITIQNVQTAYKWNKDYISQFDFIIADESHELFTPEYGKLFINASELGIPILGLSGTPDYKNKKEFYDKYCPIKMEYYDVEGDITNKVKLYLYQYDLSDTYKIETGTKDKRWKVGELKQYLYLSKKYEEAKKKMFELGASEYFDTSILWMKGKQRVLSPLPEEYATYIEVEATKEQKEWGRKFFNSIRYRKDFLWNLSSSVAHANNIKYRILSNPSNKVFLFTKSISQTYKLSPNVIHSKVAKAAKDIEALNKHTLDKFNKGIIRELASVNSLTSGINVVGLNWIIVDGFDSSDVKSQQIKGRGRRLELDNEANMIVIVPRQTQAITWFKNSYGDMDYEVLDSIENLKI